MPTFKVKIEPKEKWKCPISICSKFWNGQKPQGCVMFPKCHFFQLELWHYCHRKGKYGKQQQYTINDETNRFSYQKKVNKHFTPQCVKQKCPYAEYCCLDIKPKNITKVFFVTQENNTFGVGKH